MNAQKILQFFGPPCSFLVLHKTKHKADNFQKHITNSAPAVRVALKPANLPTAVNLQDPVLSRSLLGTNLFAVSDHEPTQSTRLNISLGWT